MARCAGCSAPLPPHGPVCAYCGLRNAVDLEGVHRYTVVGPATSRTCPRCATTLETLNVQGEGIFLLERCPDCFGLFFDPGELEALLETSVQNVFRIDYQALSAAVEAQGPRTVRYARCPTCTTVMNRVNFGSRSGVIVDQCRDHGVWLEGGELRQLLEWRKAGGQLLHEKLRRERSEAEDQERRREASSAAFARGTWAEPDRPAGPPLPDLLAGLLTRLFR